MEVLNDININLKNDAALFFPLDFTSKAREHLEQINNIDSVNSSFT